MRRSKGGRSMESFCRPCFKSLPFRTATRELMQRVVLKDEEECREWTLNGETTTYDPYPPGLEGGN